jgi:hypothetical protein
MLAAGEELAEAATQALGMDMHFEDISEYISLRTQIFNTDNLVGPKRSGSCMRRHHRTLPRFSIC